MALDHPTSEGEEASNNTAHSPISEKLNRTNLDSTPVSAPCKEDCDDDVQFVSCTPLPKRRKSSEGAHLTLQNSLNSDGAAKEALAVVGSAPHQTSNQRNTENSQLLEYCNTGRNERKSSPGQSERLPKSGCPVDGDSDVQVSFSSPPISSHSRRAPEGSLPFQVTPSATPWADYLYGDQPDAIFKDWRPVYFSGPPAERVKSQIETEEVVHPLTPHPHVSPKTVNDLVSSSPQDPPSGSRLPVTLGSANMSDVSQTIVPVDSAKSIWSDFEYDPINHIGTRQTVPGAVDPVAGTVTWPMASTFPHNLNNNWTSTHQSWKNPQPTQIPKASINYGQNQVNYSNYSAAQTTAISRAIQQQHQSRVSSRDQVDKFSTPAVMPQTSSTPHMNTISEPMSFFRRTPQPPHMIQARTAWKGSYITNPQAQPSDILRRPSLYSIPPWPTSTSETPTPTNPKYNPQSCTESSIPGIVNGISPISSGNDSLPSCAKCPIRTKITNNSLQSLQSNTTSAATSIRYPARTVAESSSDPITRKRARHEYSPNLIVDMAETCQEVFPFAEVAARHDKPIQKVYDTFAAIIQIPLLQNAEDKRRHGSLAKRRMREYRDAKKAREKAREAGGKSQLHTVEGSTKYGIERASRSPAE